MSATPSPHSPDASSRYTVRQLVGDLLGCDPEESVGVVGKSGDVTEYHGTIVGFYDQHPSGILLFEANSSPMGKSQESLAEDALSLRVGDFVVINEQYLRDAPDVPELLEFAAEAMGAVGRVTAVHGDDSFDVRTGTHFQYLAEGRQNDGSFFECMARDHLTKIDASEVSWS